MIKVGDIIYATSGTSYKGASGNQYVERVPIKMEVLNVGSLFLTGRVIEKGMQSVTISVDYNRREDDILSQYWCLDWYTINLKKVLK